VKMSAIASITIHSSQFPEAVRRDLLESLRTRRVNHKFIMTVSSRRRNGSRCIKPIRQRGMMRIAGQFIQKPLNRRRRKSMQSAFMSSALAAAAGRRTRGC